MATHERFRALRLVCGLALVALGASCGSHPSAPSTTTPAPSAPAPREIVFPTAKRGPLRRNGTHLGKPYQVKIYPPYGTTVDDGHGGFCTNAPDVWGADVLTFMRTYIS